ncbi:hypothetical protein GCM10009559_43650 [Pseudonocardia zijingensis]|uniref:Transcriptional regulator, AbiEi antitoxin, Type IV TA system n=1 Tax=Pseudonocardia zijingensis TaxID=153376 RepID=A0ABN1QPF2_9PSEU
MAMPEPSSPPDEWHLIETRQHGVTDVRQLATMGVTRDMIVAQIDAGRWQWVLPRVYATFTGPLPRPARLVAALLYGGAAVLSHRTAAEQWGIVPVADGPVHITVPYGASAVSQQPFVVVHRSRAFEHIVVELDPPVTSRADTALDMAAAEVACGQPDARSPNCSSPGGSHRSTSSGGWRNVHRRATGVLCSPRCNSCASACSRCSRSATPSMSSGPTDCRRATGKAPSRWMASPCTRT